MSFDLNLQAAIFAHLSTALTVPVHDDVPSPTDQTGNSGFPYVTIGEDTLADWGAGDTNGADATVTVHTWSRQPGRKQVKTVQGQIYDALHLADLEIAGCHTVLCRWETSSSFMDPDGITRHGVQTFRVVFHAVP